MTLAVLACVLACLSACDRKPRDASTLPFRPLLYTEASPGARETIPGFEEWLRPHHDPVAFPGQEATTAGEADAESRKRLTDTPQHLVTTVIDILRAGVEGELPLLVPPAELLEKELRMSPDAARDRVGKIQADLMALRRALHPDAWPEYRRAEWANLLQLTQVKLGPPRAVDGSVVEPYEAFMYDTNQAFFHLVGTDVDFFLRLPRIFRDERGRWWLGASPSLSPDYRRLLAFGFDQKPELMNSDQAGLPFRDGNYWDYEIEERREGEWSGLRGLGFRDSVEDVEDLNLYRVITVRRSYRSPDRDDRRREYLQTPSHLFPCNAGCRRATGSLSALLRYLENTTALMAFPLDGRSTDSETSRRYAPVIQRLEDQYEVPAGVFDNAYKVHRRGIETEPDLIVRTGTGILAFEWRDTGTLHRAALRSMRILR